MRPSRWDSFDTRFWDRILKTDACWLWTGPLSSKGYAGRIVHEGQLYRAHRLAYLLLVGPIPEGLVLDHLCRVRHCVNPEHLEPVTSGENTLRGVGPLAVKARITAQGYCVNGHDLAEHAGSRPSADHFCRACEREGQLRYWEANRDKINARHRAEYAAKREAKLARQRELYALKRAAKAS